MFYLIELEITLFVVVGDVLYHTRKYLVVVGKKTLLYVVAENVAEQTTEILMTRIAQERAGVGEHSYKATEQTKH